MNTCKCSAGKGVSYNTGHCLKCQLPKCLPRGASYYSNVLGKWISTIDDVAEEKRHRNNMELKTKQHTTGPAQNG